VLKKIKRPTIAVVGPGRLGSALAMELARSGYEVREIIYRGRQASQAAAQALARSVEAHAATIQKACLDSELVWFSVPDGEIARAAREMAAAADWTGKVALHSSGALTSDELEALRRRGAAVASVHPMMTFVRGPAHRLKGVLFGVEGDRKAVQTAQRIVRNLGGEMFLIPKAGKAAYHAWGTFASPLLLSLLVIAEEVAHAAGVPRESARNGILPIARQTLLNYASLGSAQAFSGPIVRGDVAIVRRHLKALGGISEAKSVYIALARAALRYLPVKNRRKLREALGKGGW
jgi:predicted short-subunit dehydrogenase-like oxidoreductase (DUF2520 family)